MIELLALIGAIVVAVFLFRILFSVLGIALHILLVPLKLLFVLGVLALLPLAAHADQPPGRGGLPPPSSPAKT